MEPKVYTQDEPEYLLSLILRYKILRIPLGLTFSRADLEKDRDDMHIGLFEGDVPIACLILTDTGDHTIKMRQVAVDNIYQSKGLGRELVLFAEQYAKGKGYTLMHCHARDTARPFYLKLGYRTVGDMFMEIGIPHYYMEKDL